jgi:hypothetical protein
VAIDVHGPLDRAKDVSSCGAPFSGDSAKSACALRMLTTFPSSASRGHPLSSVRPALRDEPRKVEDGPTKTHALKTAREGCQRPVNQSAFHRRTAGT